MDFKSKTQKNLCTQWCLDNKHSHQMLTHLVKASKLDGCISIRYTRYSISEPPCGTVHGCRRSSSRIHATCYEQNEKCFISLPNRTSVKWICKTRRCAKKNIKNKGLSEYSFVPLNGMLDDQHRVSKTSGCQTPIHRPLSEETDVGCANPREVSLATKDADTQIQSMV